MKAFDGFISNDLPLPSPAEDIRITVSTATGTAKAMMPSTFASPL